VALSKSGFFSRKYGYSEGKTAMFLSKNDEQPILEFAQGGKIGISVESFLVDRQASGLSRYTLKFHQQFPRL
jgi:hypothetical protein